MYNGNDDLPMANVLLFFTFQGQAWNLNAADSQMHPSVYFAEISLIYTILQPIRSSHHTQNGKILASQALIHTSLRPMCFRYET